MNVVSFYAPRRHERHIYDFADCLALQRASCLRFGCRQIVITDLPPIAEFTTLRVDLPLALMRASLAGQLAYLESAAFDADTLLTDADTVLGSDPRAVFDGSFDLAVTTHPFSDCILNNGAIFVPLAAKGRVEKFWRAALADCGEAWGEDQRALRDALGATLEHGIAERDGIRVKFLPCPGYNWAPESEADPVKAVIVHFRGPRKRWMRRWTERHAAV